MSKGRYVVPVVLGQPSGELFLVKGEVPRETGMMLVRLGNERGLTPKDEKELAKYFERNGKPSIIPSRVKELIPINEDTASEVSREEATLVHGYINNTLPKAFNAPELKNWFIYERNGDLTPLKLARFAINLLERSERQGLVRPIAVKAMPRTNSRFENYR